MSIARRDVATKEEAFKLYCDGVSYCEINERLKLNMRIKTLELFFLYNATAEQKKERILIVNKTKYELESATIEKIFNDYASQSLFFVKKKLLCRFYRFQKDKELLIFEFTKRGFEFPEKIVLGNKSNSIFKKEVLIQKGVNNYTFIKKVKPPVRELPEKGFCKNYDDNDILCKNKIGVGCKSYCVEHYINNYVVSDTKKEQIKSNQKEIEQCKE
jgi:hypothetical protein